MANRAAFPDWHNAPVPSWGPREAPILVLGMAPGQRGANRTGRPFTGDHAGKLLYATLLRFGLATGEYQERPDDGMALTGCRVTNAVRCVPRPICRRRRRSGPATASSPASCGRCRIFGWCWRSACWRMRRCCGRWG
ncbi:uracil-DNA glycosylase family protein [Siccirubricoccus deserti]